jgi:hypothetical protein
MPDGHQTAQVLREQAARCRRLADAIWDTEVERRLLELASEFDARAVAEEERERTHPGAARP